MNGDDGSTLKRSLPSFHYFHQRAERHKSAEKVNQPNEFFSSECASLLLNTIMPFSPLWSCSSGRETGPSSNAAVEGSFSLLKRDIKSGERYSATEFASKSYRFVKNSIVEVVRYRIIFVFLII